MLKALKLDDDLDPVGVVMEIGVRRSTSRFLPRRPPEHF